MASELVFVLLATLRFLQVFSATIEDIRLEGENDSYINVKSTQDHTLSCIYRASYDDQVKSVEWIKDGSLVYSWKQGAPEATASSPLSGYVKTSEIADLQNLNFEKFSLKLSGNYTCVVDSDQGINRSQPFHLVILDVPTENFETNVTLMNELPSNSSSSSKSSNCTLLWDFKTPAIYPKPNVTCGYYSYLHDDVTDSVPAGLTMHLLMNGSWQASFDHISVQVSDIPRTERLGCAVSVPDTKYKKVVKFEDSFVIDHLIDSEGCPTVFVEPSNRLIISPEGGEANCRGDMVPSSNNLPIVLKFRCEPNSLAYFSNGTGMHNWHFQITCDSELKTWKMIEDGISTPVLNISEVLPSCVPSKNDSGLSATFSSNLSSLFLSVVLAVISNRCFVY